MTKIAASANENNKNNQKHSYNTNEDHQSNNHNTKDEEMQPCACAYNIDLDYIDVDDADCQEALLLAQFHLALQQSNSKNQRIGVHNEIGGVAGGGYLLGLIAFARKFARVILSLSLLCCILFLSFYFGSGGSNNSLDSAAALTVHSHSVSESSLLNSHMTAQQENESNHLRDYETSTLTPWRTSKT